MAVGKAKKLKATEEDFSTKTEKFITFLEYYVESGDHKQAWLDAGYSPSNIATAMGKIRDNWRLVEKLIRNRIGSHVPFALNGVVELAMNAKQESVRLKALQDILFRAGYDAALQIETSEKVSDLDNAELENELTRLLARANNAAAKEAAIEELH